ncbi:unnamed protein product [Rotaria magnacalcarata]|uniref:Uncharacterized protein n=3 Tax=Rotaria magnacalcarata TaxID=392030 RepID=A0A816ZTV2_9BILA|nr:unnamed protein product [Rotaria magnacalcarata]CAF2196634.1 unnamed protein product [Rotaria magnacalcarata]CAF2213244.1 unnamed protein product [Rotaria magnacalcarata]
MYACSCGQMYEYPLQVMGCTKADHYQRPNNNNNQVIPYQGQKASVQTEPNYNSNILLKVMKHQQFLTDITEELISGSKTEVQWAQNVQEKTTALINEVQQIKV